MSSVIYFLADLYPWWGIPFALILAELANYYRRNGNRKKMVLYLSISSVFLALAAAYFWFNGMERMRPAMQELERVFFNQK